MLPSPHDNHAYLSFLAYTNCPFSPSLFNEKNKPNRELRVSHWGSEKPRLSDVPVEGRLQFLSPLPGPSRTFQTFALERLCSSRHTATEWTQHNQACRPVMWWQHQWFGREQQNNKFTIYVFQHTHTHFWEHTPNDHRQYRSRQNCVLHL